MDAWLPTLITPTPQEGFELAVYLSRLGVKFTQPDVDIRTKRREVYADSLTVVSHVAAINFQTVAAANVYWRGVQTAGG